MHRALRGDIDRAVVAEAERLVALRHDLHRHPELSRRERRTTDRVAAALADLEASVRRGPDDLGLIVDVGPPGPRIALRADLDALALDEASGVSFASRVPGVMHACGHDVHTACLVGAARALARAAPDRAFRFLFQPAEEATPGGALDLIAAGAMEGVTAILALHCDPSRPVGRVGLQAGPLTAAADVFEVELRGRGGHGARPHETQDVVVVLTLAIQALHMAFDRHVDARTPLVMTIGTVHAGLTSPNVIPDRATFSGTVRTVDPDARDAVGPLFQRVLDGVSATWGVTYDLKLRRGAPPVVNDARAVAALREASEEVLGAGAVEPTGPPSMGGEDFGWYLDHAPGALLRLGTGVGAPLHSAAFTADDAAIPLGARVLARAALALSPTG